ncbi:methyltransferase [Streptomyces rimosus]|uniref:methyltransferase n=1 Tax=Streptomyces rimosus TaxID=1927 RepID=UPI00067C1231|nr:methyltransferase [Streptomyces rimosus]
MKVADDILHSLASAAVDGPRLVLAGPRMDPKLYGRINEVLEAVGGRWTKQAGAHVFPVDAAEAVAPVLATGEVVTLREKRNDAQYFPTPAAVVDRLLAAADLRPDMEVLEPSAGSGAIASAAAARGAVVDCIERDPGYAAVLADTGAARTVRVADFLTVAPEPVYDRVVMNPPFTRGADVEHVQHALRFLKPDGLLVAVMSQAVSYQKGAAAAFRNLVEQRGGQAEMLPEKAFAESGTGVGTILVAIPATRSAAVRPLVWPTHEQPVSGPEDFGDPAAIAREIVDSLRKATAAFDAVARALERAQQRAAPKPVVTDLPVSAGPHGQPTLFDLLDEAS